MCAAGADFAGVYGEYGGKESIQTDILTGLTGLDKSEHLTLQLLKEKKRPIHIHAKPQSRKDAKING